MTRAEILAGLETIARERLELDRPLDPRASLVGELRLDSLRLLTLAVEVENRFRIRLEPDEEAAIETVGDLVALVEKKLAAEPAGALP
jgi:acyl carrier protein